MRFNLEFLLLLIYLTFSILFCVFDSIYVLKNWTVYFRYVVTRWPVFLVILTVCSIGYTEKLKKEMRPITNGERSKSLLKNLHWAFSITVQCIQVTVIQEQSDN